MGEQFADDGLLNAQRYRGETPRPVVVPFVHDQHLMPLVLWGSLEAKNILVLNWRARQRVPVPANFQQLHSAVEEEWIY